MNKKNFNTMTIGEVLVVARGFVCEHAVIASTILLVIMCFALDIGFVKSIVISSYVCGTIYNTNKWSYARGHIEGYAKNKNDEYDTGYRVGYAKGNADGLKGCTQAKTNNDIYDNFGFGRNK